MVDYIAQYNSYKELRAEGQQGVDVDKYLEQIERQEASQFCKKKKAKAAKQPKGKPKNSQFANRGSGKYTNFSSQGTTVRKENQLKIQRGVNRKIKKYLQSVKDHCYGENDKIVDSVAAYIKENVHQMKSILIIAKKVFNYGIYQDIVSKITHFNLGSEI